MPYRATVVRSFCILLISFIATPSRGADDALPLVERVALQPLVSHAKSLTEALEFTGAPLPQATRDALDAAYSATDPAAGVRAIQEALDPLCLAHIDINPEARVKVSAGPVKPHLVEQGWRAFLVKVHNQAGLTSQLTVQSPQSGTAYSQGEPPKVKLTPEMIADRWMDLTLYTGRPLAAKLSGLEVEYRIVQIYSRDAGKRQATLSFSAGQGTQDLGFRSEVAVLFTAEASHEVTFKIKDDDGQPTMAGLTLRDPAGRIYPYQPKRLAPDFFFHPQVYRTDGETVRLPAGKYTLEISRGPEYLGQSQNITIGDGPSTIDIALKRWIDPAKLGYWSGDHHIHAAGCAHYTNPTEGVFAKDMMRHVQGEDLKVGCNLTWGPCFDFQKQFFTGKVDPVSKMPYLLRYDIEVSGFGSHRSGHLCLLRLKDQMYPGGASKDHWPTLGLNTLKFAKQQGAITGPAHSGNGIAVKDGQLPSFAIPNYDGIGANEFIVDITHNVPGPDGKLVPAVDFISTVDTDPKAELNMWYHTLNCGFRIRASGETDFPCIYGERVGMGRSYVKLDGALDFDSWCEGIQKGRSYVSDGRSHLIDMKLDTAELGKDGSELRLKAPGTAKLTAKVAAYLPEKPAGPTAGQRLAIWHLERARIPGSRMVKVEAIVNGKAVAEKEITADGATNDIAFDLKLDRSSWVALRIFASSHTNPIFAIIDDKPIRASKRSAEWCRAGVDQCWAQKQRFYAEKEQADAIAAYNHARDAYKKLVEESPAD